MKICEAQKVQEKTARPLAHVKIEPALIFVKLCAIFFLKVQVQFFFQFQMIFLNYIGPLFQNLSIATLKLFVQVRSSCARPFTHDQATLHANPFS